MKKDETKNCEIGISWLLLNVFDRHILSISV
jgi:hypothetical protein